MGLLPSTRGRPSSLQAAAAGINLPRHKVAVEACEDLRLTLLRHWTIEESLRCVHMSCAEGPSLNKTGVVLGLQAGRSRIRTKSKHWHLGHP